MTQTLESLPEDVFTRLVELHAELSPEALTGDGEIPESAWQARKFELDAALITLQLTYGLSQDDVDEAAVYREHDRRLEQSRRGQRRMRA